MTPANRAIIFFALAPNVVYVAALTGLMLWRMASGLQPLPQGATSIVMGLSIAVPMASVAMANFVRLRRRA
jgi:hypothetical protein